MGEHHDTIIVGGGQAGLAMSYHLRQRGREHIILERHRIAERWQSERWNSLHFQYPNWSLRLPGMACAEGDPDGFAHYPRIARFIENYASTIDAPVRTGVAVTALRRDSSSGNLEIETASGVVYARHIVIATGPFQRPLIPGFHTELPSWVYQADATSYRGPEELPSGAVLVVGSGASGSQIADELLQSGRKVFLSVSRHRRVPRRYRGKDAFWWFEKTGRLDTTIDTFPNRMYPPSTVITGANGGYDIDARRFAAEGGTLLGRVKHVVNGTLSTGDDAKQVLAEADQAYMDFVRAADAVALQPAYRGMLEEVDSRPPPAYPDDVDGTGKLNLRDANIRAIIWCTGYRFDFDWVKVPVLDTSGAPVQQRGVTPFPGVYFLGLHWMHTFKSGQLSFVGEDAAYIADHIDGRDRI